ncbi:acyl-coenzyme A amino acid N-acyltransferase 2-like isoform X2 [Haliotis rubra]|uniref:acyl-coenzyme A amino acid N-acyltransferase 2-like isoform X2 n=1 Tax=Haliotis rubra TaxID=36100 RepID=UPI001EE502D0|nr:acyl-coenzyme A amino acid N-acyltransferase 2-like isoform X2 [Haliotis rubra]
MSCTRVMARQFTSGGQTCPSRPCLNVSPGVALVDERISITVSSLRPLQRVTVQAWVEERKAVFSSCGYFVADQHGQVDISQLASLGGTYKGVDSMGLFWSLKPVPGASMKTRIITSDVTTPLVFKLSVIDDHIPFDDLQLPTTVVLATGVVKRWYKHSAVRKIVVREGSLRGALFLPAGVGPFPGVLDMFGSTGGLVEFRAALLASQGFASFALGYFGYDDLPKTLADLDLDYFLDAVDWLASHPNVQPGGIGVVGTSKGGELAFVLGMSCDKVKAVVNISGSPIFSFADLKKSGKSHVKALEMDFSKLDYSDEGITTRNSFQYDTSTFIPVWKKNAAVLYLCGEEDGTWNTQHAKTFKDSFPAEKRDNIELVIYPRTGHLIEPPYMPLCRTSYHRVLDMVLVWGGQPEAHAAAQEDAWKRILHFLHKHLPQEHHTSSRL